MMLTTLQKMTMLWIRNGNAGTIPLSHTGLVSGILVNNMPVNLVHKQVFKMEYKYYEHSEKGFVCTFKIIDIII